MNNNFYILLAISFLFISCKDQDKKETNNDPIPEIKETKIDIDGLVYEISFDGIRSEGDYDETVGTYVENRLGNTKKALSMDGLSQYVKVERHGNINTKEGITVSIWYKPISFKGSGNDPIVLKPNESNINSLPQYTIGVTGNERSNEKVRASFRFGLNVDGKYRSIRTKADAWTPNNWYNIVGTYDGTSMKLYVNGDVLNNKTVKGKLENYNTDLFIGMHNSNKYGTPGTYDNFSIYNRALTKTEIEKLAN